MAFANDTKESKILLSDYAVKLHSHVTRNSFIMSQQLGHLALGSRDAIKAVTMDEMGDFAYPDPFNFELFKSKGHPAKDVLKKFILYMYALTNGQFDKEKLGILSINFIRVENPFIICPLSHLPDTLDYAKSIGCIPNNALYHYIDDWVNTESEHKANKGDFFGFPLDPTLVISPKKGFINPGNVTFAPKVQPKEQRYTLKDQEKTWSAVELVVELGMKKGYLKDLISKIQELCDFVEVKQVVQPGKKPTETFTLTASQLEVLINKMNKTPKLASFCDKYCIKH